MAKPIKSEIIVRDLPKKGGLDTLNIYIKNAVVFYASVHDPKKKYNSEDREYSATVFVDEDAKDNLFDDVLVNKTFAEVGKTKTSKPPKRIKYPLSSQVEEGKTNYDLVEGMWGFNVAKPEFSKAGNPMSVNVIDAEGNTFTENVGNGSVVNLKLFSYRNVDGQAVVTLDTMQVVEHVPYEGSGDAGSVVDDVLGVSYQVKKAEAKVEEAKASTKAVVNKVAEEDDDLDRIPF